MELEFGNHKTNVASTKALTKSFGSRDTAGSFVQHDVQELSRVLLDRLDDSARGTPVQSCT